MRGRGSLKLFLAAYAYLGLIPIIRTRRAPVNGHAPICWLYLDFWRVFEIYLDFLKTLIFECSRFSKECSRSTLIFWVPRFRVFEIFSRFTLIFWIPRDLFVFEIYLDFWNSLISECSRFFNEYPPGLRGFVMVYPPGLRGTCSGLPTGFERGRLWGHFILCSTCKQ